MTRPYLFRWFRDGRDALTAVPLTEEPTVGAIVYVAGERYKIVSVDEDSDPPIIIIDTPEKGYREPKAKEEGW